MRDFRDAKAMAHTLRAALAAKGFKITIGQSLELMAKLFGVADWTERHAPSFPDVARAPSGLRATALGFSLSKRGATSRNRPQGFTNAGPPE
jgi:hypothetical protein